MARNLSGDFSTWIGVISEARAKLGVTGVMAT